MHDDSMRDGGADAGLYADVVEQLRAVTRNVEATVEASDPTAPVIEMVAEVGRSAETRERLLDVALRALASLHDACDAVAVFAAIEEADAGWWLSPALLERAFGTVAPDSGGER